LTIGKKFRINPSKLIRKKNEEDDTDEIKEDKGYFCSELVASALKRVGLLDKELASSRYWPGDFSNELLERSVKLNKGARLGEELVIDFNL